MAVNYDSHIRYGALDVKTDGPYGAVVAIGGVIYRSPHDIQDEFFARMPDTFVHNPLVKECLLPAIADERPTHTVYRVMLEEFAHWYLSHAAHTSWIGTGGNYLGYATLFRDVQKHGYLNDTSQPPHLIDVFTAMLLAGETSQTVEEYAERRKLPSLLKTITEPMHPIRFCCMAAGAFFDLVKRSKNGAAFDNMAAQPVRPIVITVPSVHSSPKRHRSDELTPIIKIEPDEDRVGATPASNEPTEGVGTSTRANGGASSSFEQSVLADMNFDEDDDVDDKKSE